MSARVLIAGGGVAGLEAALALRDLAGDRADVEIWAPRRDFVYRPFSVGEPFGASRVIRHDLEEITERIGITFAWAGLRSFDPARRVATSLDGDSGDYDYLILAPGAKHLASIPGATTFWGLGDEFDAEALVRGLGTRSLRHLVFAMPGGQSWTLPLYELALLARARERHDRSDTRTKITIVTPEDSPLAIFGPGVTRSVADLLEANEIDVLCGTHAVAFDQARGALSVAPRSTVPADGVVGLPRIEGRRFPGIPHDERGFVPTDEHCGVVGLDGVFAAGDITNFPIKQGGIAAQQADAAAARIALELGRAVDAEPFEPVLRGVLWTGDGPRYLQAHPVGGHGESSTMSDLPPWPDQPGKIVSRYLARFLGDLPAGSAGSAGLAG